MLASNMRLLFVASVLIFLADGQQYQPSYVMSSSWSMWSPWSFCSHGVMIRVRACSTVRGFKCIGHNKEFQSCDSRASNPKNLDYSSEENDRELAMHQLYDDYDSNSSPHTKTPTETSKGSLRTRRPKVYTTSPALTTTTTISTTTTATTTTTTTTPVPQTVTTTTEAPTTASVEVLSSEESDSDISDLAILHNNMKFNIKPSDVEISGDPTVEVELLTPAIGKVVEPTTLATPSTKARRYFKASYVTKAPVVATIPPQQPQPRLKFVQAIRDREWAQGTTTAEPIEITSRSEFEYNSHEFELAAPQRKSYPIVTDSDVFDQPETKVSDEAQVHNIENQEKKHRAEPNEGTFSLNSWGANDIQESNDEPVEIVQAVQPTTTTTTTSTTTTPETTSTTTTEAPAPPVIFDIESGIMEEITTTAKPHHVRKLKNKGKKSRLARLRRLNERAKIRTLAVIATQKNRFNSGEVKPKETVPENTDNSLVDGQIEDENITEDDMLSGDTARALSWLLANMTASVDDNDEVPIADSIQLEKIINQPSSFSISKVEDDGASSFQGQFSEPLSTSELSQSEAKPEISELQTSDVDDEEMWSGWSGWSSCNCGFAYRKRTCISKTVKCDEPTQFEKKTCESVMDNCEQR